MPEAQRPAPAASARSLQLIVTRPAAQAAKWVASLQAQGLAAQALPLIEIAATDPRPAQAAWHHASQYAASLFVSPQAVSHFFAARPAQAPPWQARCLVTGPGSRAALLQAGVAPERIDSPAPDAPQFDSEALWAVVSTRPWQGLRVLVVRGRDGGCDGAGHDRSAAHQGDDRSDGREWIAQQWQAGGAQVESLCVYERRAPVWTPALQARVRALAAPDCCWLFSSSQAVRHLLPGDWSQARALATHARIAQAVRQAGFGRVQVCRPTLADVLHSIKSQGA